MPSSTKKTTTGLERIIEMLEEASSDFDWAVSEAQDALEAELDMARQAYEDLKSAGIELDEDLEDELETLIDDIDNDIPS